MNPNIERFEIFWDGGTEPLQVLTEPPFLLKLNTTILPDGEHTLRIVTYYKSGQHLEERRNLIVNNLPGVLVDGVEEGEEVHGDLELELKPGDYQAPREGERGSGWPYFIIMLVILGAVWGFFALTGTSNKIVASVAAQKAPAASSSISTSSSSSQGATVPVDQALLTEGKALYAQHCAACHQATGEGIPGAFPPFAGNANLKDVTLVVDTILKGKQGQITVKGQSFNGMMPAFASQLSDKQVAAVATYIRNDFGNSFGGVSEAQVKAGR